MNRVFCILIVSFWFSGLAFGQQLHFSQYFNTPLLVNPANTGFNPDYDYRFGGSYRNQWANIMTNPYKTMNLWGDAQLFTNKIESGWAGIGGTLYKDQAGSENLTSTQGYLSVAYHQMLGNSSLLSLGFGGGLINKQIDISKLTFDNWDYNSQSFSPYNGNYINSNTSYFDLQLGINYALFVSNTAYYNIGISAMHINKPIESFIVSSSGQNQIVPVRTNLFLNANFKIEDLWILNPNLYISNSAGRNEVLVGINVNRNLSGDGVKQLIAGIYYRSNDAVIPMIGYQVNDAKVTLSYDVTTSYLGSFNNNQGGYELSIIKNSSYPKDHPIKCPSMKF